MTATTTSVLIVDDHPDTASMLQKALRRHGIDAEIAFDGPAALAWLATCKPEVIILDQMMPGMTGMEVLMRLRQDEEFNDLKVIIYSVLYDWQMQRDAYLLGVNAWLVKGAVKIEDLVAKVSELRDGLNDSSLDFN